MEDCENAKKNGDTSWKTCKKMETMLEEEETENKEMFMHKFPYSTMQLTAVGSTPF